MVNSSRKFSSGLPMERGGGFCHHEPRGELGEREIVAPRGVGNHKIGEAFGNRVAESLAKFMLHEHALKFLAENVA
jgi:hypothetical protein